MKKLILAVVFMVFIITSTAAAATEVNVEVNGNQVNFPDQKPFIDEDVNRTYVPLRFVSEALGGDVDWKGSQQTATVDRNGKHIEMQIGSKAPMVDGKKMSLDAPARLTNARTVVPLRFVSEALGAKVEWVADTRTVEITDQDNTGDQGNVTDGNNESQGSTGQQVTEFEGQDLNPDDYIVAERKAIPYEFKQPSASIMHITTDELKQHPVKLGNDEDGFKTIYDVKVTEKTVYVKQTGSALTPINLILAKGNDVSVQRSYGVIVKYNESPFTHEYPVSLKADPGGSTKIENVTTIMLLYDNQVLAVENPLYKGAE